MFNQDSALVKIWVSVILTGSYQYKDTPKLSNLREEVGKKLVEIGYDIENEE